MFDGDEVIYFIKLFICLVLFSCFLAIPLTCSVREEIVEKRWEEFKKTHNCILIKSDTTGFWSDQYEWDCDGIVIINKQRK